MYQTNHLHSKHGRLERGFVFYKNKYIVVHFFGAYYLVGPFHEKKNKEIQTLLYKRRKVFVTRVVVSHQFIFRNTRDIHDDCKPTEPCGHQ